MKLVMIGFGALIAVAGLWLIFRPPGDGSKTVLHILGLKFEAASAGTLVFIVGIGVFGVSLFAPVDPMVQTDVASGQQATISGRSDRSAAGGSGPSDASPDQSSRASAAVTTIEADPAAVATREARALTVVGAEVEPNDNIAEANEIPVGSVISGLVTDDTADWYTFTFPDDFVGTLSVNLTGDARLRIYDDLGKRVYQGSYASTVKYPRYYVSVTTNERRADYTLTVAARPE